MQYPVLSEQQLATRWSISKKTLQRWRANQIGPKFQKLFNHVRYHEHDVQEFENKSAKHLMKFLDRNETEPIALAIPANKIANANNHGEAEVSILESVYSTSKEVARITGLPICFFLDRNLRNGKKVPHFSLVGNVRFSVSEIYQWELVNSLSKRVASTRTPRQ